MLSIVLFNNPHGGPDVTWLMWVAFGFFAVMVVVGWLSAKRTKPEEPLHDDPKEQAETLSHDPPSH